MDLVTPSIGLVFWSTISFLVLFFLLTKFAWKPITAALQEREDSIDEALKAAENARKQMEKLTADNEKLLNQARAERDAMLKDANDMKESIIAQAKKSAAEEGNKMIANAKASIEQEKVAAMNELKTQVALISVDMAEKILRKKMEDRTQQEAFVNENLKSISLN
ncbi:ATP F0F1 synthase subunit B [Bacteroidetes bacterium UKL13-3]|jgi:F-type H+-transporting ATPase subunit b|nr:ATP F0F1 synthase subunit B [Bacteroidetes bacterium UKL13-3]HCP93829.1 F0F1 ATP synthase subunit B [Bacteroidota bacterium]